jgi:formylglycine-generating enzyme required for sulfatase activity
MHTSRTTAARLAAFLSGLLLTVLLLETTGLQSRELIPPDHGLKRIRQLAASADPSLAQVLDRTSVQIPEGEFLMGSQDGRSNEGPVRSVFLDSYEIDRIEVSNIQYRRFIEATRRKPPRYWHGLDFPIGQADIPVVGVGWKDAQAYCLWVGKRLPTEAEWEKACRGTDGREYPWGDRWLFGRANVGLPYWQAQPGRWDEAWNFLRLGRTIAGTPSLQPVGTYPLGASPFGVMDMAGNAAEWVMDWYNWGDYSDLPTRNPLVSGPHWNRCLRGSSWFLPYGNVQEAFDQSRCAARNSSHAVSGDARTGFRCARSIQPAAPQD